MYEKNWGKSIAVFINITYFIILLEVILQKQGVRFLVRYR